MPEDLFRPQLGEPHHCAYVVDDIEATVSRLVDQLGAGPFFLIENVPLENVRSRGEPAEFVHNSAFGYCGGGAIELMQVLRLAPERVQNGFSGPRPRIHHVAYVLPPTEVADVRGSLDDRGLTEYLSSQFGEVETTASRRLRRPRPRHRDPRRERGPPRLLRDGEGGRRRMGRGGTAAPGRELIGREKAESRSVRPALPKPGLSYAR